MRKLFSLLLLVCLCGSLFVGLVPFVKSASVFTDGFEAGFDNPPWSANLTSGVWAIDDIDGQVYQGYFSGNFSTLSAGSCAAYVRKDLSVEISTLYMFGMFYFEDALIHSGYSNRMLWASHVGMSTGVVNAEQYYNGSHSVWAVVYRNNSVLNNRIVSSSVVAVDTWYEVQLNINCSSADGTFDGNAQLIVDGAVVVSVSNIDTDVYRHLDQVWFGRGRMQPTSGNIDIGSSYVDACEIADSLIEFDEPPVNPPFDDTYAGLIEDYMILNSSYPDLVDMTPIFESYLGEWAYAVTVGYQSDRKVLLTSACHGGEYFGAYPVYAFIDWLLTASTEDSEALLNRLQFVVIPAVNIDNWNGGQSAGRKNVNASWSPYGVDLSRNFVTGWGGSSSSNPTAYNYRSESALDQNESIGVRDLIDLYVGDWVVGVDMHGYASPQFNFVQNSTEFHVLYNLYDDYAVAMGIGVIPEYATSSRGMLCEDFSVFGDGVGFLYECSMAVPDYNTMFVTIRDELIALMLAVNDVYGLDYVEPEPTPTPTPSPTVVPTATPVGGGVTTYSNDFLVLWVTLIFIVICFFMMVLPLPWLPRFVFGVLSLMVCAVSLGTTIVLQPYIQLTGLLMSVMVMLVAAVKGRS